MSCRAVVSGLVWSVVVGSFGVGGLAEAQEVPRTGWGAPDLQGVWDFRTITPMQRPEHYGDKEFLTPEEAAELDAAEELSHIHICRCRRIERCRSRRSPYH